MPPPDILDTRTDRPTDGEQPSISRGDFCSNGSFERKQAAATAAAALLLSGQLVSDLVIREGQDYCIVLWVAKGKEQGKGSFTNLQLAFIFFLMARQKINSEKKNLVGIKCHGIFLRTYRRHDDVKWEPVVNGWYRGAWKAKITKIQHEPEIFTNTWHLGFFMYCVFFFPALLLV